MRVFDFITEGMMEYPNWSKHDPKKGYYYTEPFLEGLLASQVYAFNVGGDKFDGIIQNPKQVKSQMMAALKGQDEWKNIVFTVKVLDDEGESTGEFKEGVHLNQIYKDEKIKGSLNPNMGNISEIILGCAVTARFEKLGQQIREEDVMSMGQRLAEGKGEIVTKAGKDALQFTIKTVPFLDKKTFYVYVGKYPGKTLKDFNMPAEKIAELATAVSSAVAYANQSKRVNSAIQKVSQDPARNTVDVISDGGEKENQSTTKVDLKILIDGQTLSKNLLSIKAGNVKQFGQVGGSNFVNLNEFFSTTVGLTLSDAVKKKFKEIPVGTRNTGDLKQHNFDVAFPAAYKEIAKELKAMSQTDQAALVKNVYKGLMYHLTRNEPGVEMVILSPSAKKAFQELSFGPEFRKAINQLHLTVDINFTEKAYWLFVYGFPATEFSKKSIGTAKHKLVELWSAYSPKSGVMRNRVGMGNLLKDIADLENIIEKKQAQPKAVKAPQPVNTTQPVKKINSPVVKPKTPPKVPTGEPMGMDSPADTSIPIKTTY